MVAEKVLFHALLSLWCSCSAIGSDRYCVNVHLFQSGKVWTLQLRSALWFLVINMFIRWKCSWTRIYQAHMQSAGLALLVALASNAEAKYLCRGVRRVIRNVEEKYPLQAHWEDCSADSRMSRSPDAWPVAVVEAGETKCSVKWEFVYKRVTFLLFCTWFSRELVSGFGFRIVLFQFCSQKGRVSSPSRIVL